MSKRISAIAALGLTAIASTAFAGNVSFEVPVNPANLERAQKIVVAAGTFPAGRALTEDALTDEIQYSTLFENIPDKTPQGRGDKCFVAFLAQAATYGDTGVVHSVIDDHGAFASVKQCAKTSGPLYLGLNK